VCISHFFKNRGVRVRHRAGTTCDPGPHAIGGIVHGRERRSTEKVMDEGRGESIARANGVLDADREAPVLV